MSPSDGSDGADFPFSTAPEALVGPDVGTLLFESLCYVLIEKGVLTKNDAMSVVETVAQVKRGSCLDGAPSEREAADLSLLRRLFTSFEALDDRPTDANFAGGNVHRLRPPLHDDRPAFPEDDD